MGFDIIFEEYNIWQNFYVLSLYVVILTAFYRSNVSAGKIWNTHSTSRTVILFILYLLLTLTLFNDHDYYGLWQSVKLSSLGEGTHLEAPYRAIALYFERNYLMFRFTVWGGALVLFCIGARESGITVYHAIYMLAICFSSTFAYGRVSLAMAFCFCGYALFYHNKKRNIFKNVIGIALFCCAYYFHKSIVIAMFMAVIMTFVPINKKTIWVLLLLLPLLIVVAKYGILHVIETGVGMQDDTAKAATLYSSVSKASSNFFGFIGEILQYGRFYLAAYIGIKAMYLNPNGTPNVSVLIRNLFKISLGLIFVGTIFFFMDFDNNIFAYRIMFMTMIPIVYCLIKLYGVGAIPYSKYKFYFWWCIIANLFGHLYSVYMLL